MPDGLWPPPEWWSRQGLSASMPLIFRCTIFHSFSPSLLACRWRRSAQFSMHSAALDALGCVDDMGLADLRPRWPRPGRRWAHSVQPLHLIRVDDVVEQRLADASRTALILDVGDRTHRGNSCSGGEHRVRRGLAQAAQAAGCAYARHSSSILSRSSIVAVAVGNFRPEAPAAAWCRCGRGCTCRRLSSTVNSRKNLAISTMQLSSSMTIRPPEPIMEPMAIRLS